MCSRIELIDLLPFPLATPLARYIGQFGDHGPTPPEFSFLEAALTLAGYVAFSEYCALGRSARAYSRISGSGLPVRCGSFSATP